MTEGPEVTAARAAYARRDWVSARVAFEAARGRAALAAVDVGRLAECAWWLGDLDRALPELEQAYRLHLAEDDRPSASRVALAIGYTYLVRGQPARSSGWMGRAARLLEQVPEGPEHGYLLHVDFETAFAAFDLEAALTAASRVAELGERFGDVTLEALGALGRGRVLVRRGRVADGLALLDEAMVGAVSEPLEPLWAGNVYCHLMLACFEIADIGRAREWTEATARWCETMPGAGPFMGICRVHRARLLQVRGAWSDAERELDRVEEDPGHFDVEVVAEAHYRRGEGRRLHGDLDGAEAEYRAAHRLGRQPQPGLALVELARGSTASAAASLRSALAATQDAPLARGPMLPAAVEVCLAAGDVSGAATAAAELDRLAVTYGTPGFAAESCTARGALLLAEGSAEAALAPLRQALRVWQHLGAPLDAARARLLLARAYAATGDAESAVLERQAAQADCARLDACLPGRPGEDGWHTARAGGLRCDGLTPREAEVLGLVATGRSNQEIAARLVLSVRTVERHLATVYRKLGVHGPSARAAAVSHALTGPAPSR